MPGWAKALIVTLCVVVALVIGALVVGIVYVASNKDAWKARGREVVADGKNFGVNSDNQGCLDESIARYKSTERHLNAISTNLFMQSCLESSRPTSMSRFRRASSSRAFARITALSMRHNPPAPLRG